MRGMPNISPQYLAYEQQPCVFGQLMYFSGNQEITHDVNV